MSTFNISRKLLESIRQVVSGETEYEVVEKKDLISEAYADMLDENTEFEIYEINDTLEEGAGSLAGLPKHIAKVITKHHGGGENSSVVDHGPITSHSKLHGALSNAMKDHNGTHVLYHNDKPIGALHTSYVASGTRPEYGIEKTDGPVKAKHSEKVHGTGKYDNRAGKYIPLRIHEYETPKHNKDNALMKMIHHIASRHAGDADMTDKSTYKAHKFEVKTFKPDAARKEKKEIRAGARPHPDNSTLKRNTDKAVEKMANKHLAGDGPLTKTKELHAALGKAIESGDHKAVRQHLGALDSHTKYSDSMKNDSYDKSSYKDAVKKLKRGTREAARNENGYSWDKKRGREDINRLKEKGAIKEDFDESLFTDEELNLFIESVLVDMQPEDTEITEGTKRLDKVHIVHHDDDAESKEFAKNYTSGHKGDHRAGGPVDGDDAAADKFHDRYSKVYGKSGFGGSGTSIFHDKKTDSHWKVSRRPNGKTFYGTDHIITKHTGPLPTKEDIDDLNSVFSEEELNYINTVLENEQIDELSKGTLGSYIKKASDSKAGSLATAVTSTDKNTTVKSSAKYGKRSLGINRAVDKLTKEEVEPIEELSTKTLKSYVKKATTSANRAWAKSDSEEDKAMSTDGTKYPEKQQRHIDNAKAADKIWRKRDKGHTMASKQLNKDKYK